MKFMSVLLVINFSHFSMYFAFYIYTQDCSDIHEIKRFPVKDMKIPFSYIFGQ